MLVMKKQRHDASPLEVSSQKDLLSLRNKTICKYLKTCFLMSQLFFLYFNKGEYRISSVIRRRIFLPKQSQRSRSVLEDGSRSLGLFRKGKIGIIAKFHRTNLVI